MDLNDHSHLYFIFDLTPSPQKPRKKRALVREANECIPDVYDLQRHLATAMPNIAVHCGKDLAVTDSAPLPTSALLSSANSRSPPLSNRLLFPA